tara:strand:+ start:570 stop:842 length:273 start_codon:yes stop_codon:yes gene_type:complete
MSYFIEIKSSNNRPGTTLVGRSGNRIAYNLMHEVEDNPDFAFPNLHTASRALVVAINDLRLKQVEAGRGFTTEYKLNLLKRLNKAWFVLS